VIDGNYSPSRVGCPCAAMIRFRPDMVNESRIEAYPLSQWGLLGDYDGPENATLRWMLKRASAGNPVEVS